MIVQSAIILTLAIGLRVAAIFELGELPIARTPQLDSAAYLSWARALVDNPSFWPEYPEHAPGYPIFMAIVLAVSGGSLTAIRLVQCLLGAVGCVLIARVAARTLTPRAFLPAGMLQAAYAPFVYIDTSLLSESLLVFLLVVTLDLATAAGLDRRKWFLAGLSLGAAAIVRPTALALLMAFAAVLWLAMKRKPALRLAAAFAAGTLIVVAAVALQNWRVTGIPLIQAYGGMNFYLGNRPSGDGAARARLGGEWDQLEGAASRAGASRNDQDAYYVSRAVDEIASAPGTYARLVGSKLLWAIQDEELRDTHSYYFFEDAMPLLQWLPSFGFVVAFAAVGMVMVRNPGERWLIAYLIAMLATVAFLVVGTRYRIPTVPALIAFAGAGMATIIERLRQREWKSVAMLAVIAVLAGAAAHIRRDDASRNLGEEWAFTGLSFLQEGRLEDAERAYRTAIGLDGSSFAWDGLGLVLQRREMRSAAGEAFERAVNINPMNATAWLHLGLSYEFLGNGRAAVAAYEKALSIMPARTEAREVLEAARRRYQLF